jgi:hypothetical protein
VTGLDYDTEINYFTSCFVWMRNVSFFDWTI